MRDYKNAWLIVAVSFALGFSGGVLLKYFSPVSSQAQSFSKTVTAQELRLLNAQGNLFGQWVGKNANGLFLFDQSGRARIDIGLFADGRPTISLDDERHVPKALLKLEWDKNIPMFFMKEPIDRNRLIMALDLKNSEVPFLVLFDKNGQKKEIFGKFEMP